MTTAQDDMDATQDIELLKRRDAARKKMDEKFALVKATEELLRIVIAQHDAARDEWLRSL